MKKLIDYIIEALSNTQIFEMAYSRKELIKRIEGLAKQIVENWCLVKYCSVYDKDNINRNHWKNELMSHLYNVFEMFYKGDKYSVLSNVLIDKKELHRSNTIKLIIRRKFLTENIDIKTSICDMFCGDLLTLIELMSNKETNENSDKIYDYVTNL